MSPLIFMPGQVTNFLSKSGHSKIISTPCFHADRCPNVRHGHKLTLMGSDFGDIALGEARFAQIVGIKEIGTEYSLIMKDLNA